MDRARELRLALLNPWQRDFPLLREPWAVIAGQVGLAVPELLAHYAALQREGALSRIGGVFAASAGGAALLAAMAVPPARLDAVATLVSAHPGVNHNYAREHALNLWFVMTGRDAGAVEQAVRELEAATGLAALRLRLQRPYRIDLGFDLRERTAGAPPPPAGRAEGPTAAALDEPGRALAARVEDGLPLVERPFDRWAEALGCSPDAVLRRLQDWLARGVLRRFGAIVRHHEFGFEANAMTVFDVPDAEVDRCGEALAREAGVTLAYRRERAPGWPYNLYCMVHGTDRAAVHEVLARVLPRCGLGPWPQAVLFSTRRYKQTGARRFRPLPPAELKECPHAHA